MLGEVKMEYVIVTDSSCNLSNKQIEDASNKSPLKNVKLPKKKIKESAE